MASVDEDIPRDSWFKSSRSAANGNCVEVAFVSGNVAVRDSKDPTGPVLRFTATGWRDFLGSVRSGAQELPDR
jgi:hypothetical protein